MEKGIFKLTMLTSVVMPAIMICVFPVAFTALRKSSLSHAFTSPFRLMCGAFGCIAVISLGSGPLGPIQSRISTSKSMEIGWPPPPTCFSTGSQDGWQVEHFANGGVGYDVILE